MSRHRVLCVQKSYRMENHNRIEFIGGTNFNGTRWKVSQLRAIEAIESGKWEFYVESNGQVAEVIISSYNNYKFLKTTSDNLESNNLLNLPTCP